MYIPYTGGAGPSVEQVHDNNLALLTFLKTQGFEPQLGVLSDLLPDDVEVEDDVEVVFWVNKNGRVHHVDYDRWGFVSLTLNLDQTGWDETVQTILQS